MTSSSSRSSIFRRVIGIVLFALGLLGGTSLVTKEYRLALFGERSTGTVRKVDEITTSTSSKWVKKGNRKHLVSKSSPSHFMHIGFTTREGKHVEVETLATFNTEAKVGDTHPMIYLPSQPENAKIYSAKQLWMPMVIGTVFTAICLFLGFYFLRSAAS